MIYGLLASNSYLVLNKELCRKLGMEESALLSELCNEHEYWREKNKLTADGYFFSTIENIECALGMSEYKQRNIIKKLEELNIIEMQLRDLPPKRYFKLNDNEILKLLGVKSLIISETNPKEFSSNINKEIILKEDINANALSKANALAKEEKNPMNSLLKEIIEQQTKPPAEGAKKSNRRPGKEVAMENIRYAQETGDWSGVGPRNLSYYFNEQFLKRYGKSDPTFDPYTGQPAIIMKQFIERNSIATKDVCGIIDKMFDTHINFQYGDEKDPYLNITLLRNDPVTKQLLKGKAWGDWDNTKPVKSKDNISLDDLEISKSRRTGLQADERF